MHITVHIGSTKTGTSALQLFLYQNKKTLLSQGVVYPDVGISNGAHHVLSSLFHQNAFQMHSMDIGGRPLSEIEGVYRKKISKIIKRHPGKKMVLSSEYLWSSNKRKDFIAFLMACGATSVSILCYLREINEWLQSQYNQAVKSGQELNFQDWFEGLKTKPTPIFDYKAALEGWLEAGASKVEARIYSEKTLTMGIFSDFLTSINVNSTGFDLNEQQLVNVSPDIGSIELIRVLNSMALPKADKNIFRKYLLETSKKRKLHQKILLMDERSHEYIKKNLRESIKYVEDKYVVPEHRNVKLYENIFDFREGDEKLEDLTRALLKVIIRLAENNFNWK